MAAGPGEHHRPHRPPAAPYLPPFPPSAPPYIAPPPSGPWKWRNCQSTGDCDTNVLLGVGCGVVLVALLVQQCVAALHRRNVRLFTETAALMVLGAAVQGIYYLSVVSSGQPWHTAHSIVRDPNVHDLIYYALLPPIIFEAGFTMRKRKFFANFLSILLFFSRDEICVARFNEMVRLQVLDLE